MILSNAPWSRFRARGLRSGAPQSQFGALGAKIWKSGAKIFGALGQDGGLHGRDLGLWGQNLGARGPRSRTLGLWDSGAKIGATWSRFEALGPILGSPQS